MRRQGKARAKGQLVFEFIIAMVIFFGIVFYALNYLSWTVAGYSSDFSVQSMESEASQIGELLVLNKGNWSAGQPVTPGLAQEWPVLNSSKISLLNSSCNSDYWGFMNRLDVQPRYRARVTITEALPSGTTAMRADCPWGQMMSASAAKVEAKRYALSESGNILTVYVAVWTTGK